MTNSTDQLTALHELAKTWPGGVEKCEWWAECVDTHSYYSGEVEWQYWSEPMHAEHALDLVTCEAERWLKERQWAKHDNPRNGLLYYSVGPDSVPDASTLHEALTYAQEQTQTKETP